MREYPLQAIADALVLSDAIVDVASPEGYGVSYNVAGKIVDELLAGPLDDIRVLDALFRRKFAQYEEALRDVSSAAGGDGVLFHGRVVADGQGASS